MDEIQQYRDYINNSFEFSEFQTKSCLSIVEDKHVLVTAHTGSGKTLPAEFSIFYNIKIKGKKVIYTSPIKALSNQKYKEFSTKFPDIEVGILTGDIKHNPGADLLIMTTEILQNHCFKSKNKGLYLDFNIDLENELGSVIFDEVHYIDDPDRGTVWEQTMISLPLKIPFVMLSATIGEKEHFAKWISDITKKDVVICSSSRRVVPLQFYEYFTIPNKYIKDLKDKNKKKMFENKLTDELNIIKTQDDYKYNQLEVTKKCITELRKDKFRVPQKFVLNECLKTLKNNDMFPCLLFVFSRKKVESISKEIFVDLFLEDEKDYMIKPIFMKKLVSRISNWKEYISLPECEMYINLLEKGIGIHHAGMLPVFREIMEILYEERYIKILIATETFAIGLNMPTRTVLFNSLYKHDGVQNRLLKSHEFIQMAGRAGRRNIDNIGHVILLTNNYDPLTQVEYHKLFHTTPKVLSSKFRITYNVILSYLDSFTKEEMIKMTQKSLMNVEITNQISMSKVNLHKLIASKEIVEKKCALSHDELITFFSHYESLKEKITFSNNKQKKKLLKEVRTFEQSDMFSFYSHYNELKVIETSIKNESRSIVYAESYIETQINSLFDIMYKNGYINQDNRATLTGLNASYIHELPCLVFCDTYNNFGKFNNHSEAEIVSFLSCFYDLKLKDDFIINYPNSLKDELRYTQDRINYYIDKECQTELCITSKFNLQYNLIDYVSEWYNNVSSIEETKFFFDKISRELDIFTGDFIKCCMKIINMCNELIILCENDCNYPLLEKINNIQSNLQKSIVSNRSLYL
tara:strand:- start:3104 stop:5518 length:2415 start_codon:yes stop_codon:yes gene_type:complete